MNSSSSIPGSWSRVAAALALAIATSGATTLAWADPPSRIARLSYYAGTATFSPAGDDQWGAAVLNRPVATGDRLWSDDGARVELTLDNGALWLGAATSVIVTNIDDATTQFQLQQGTVELRVRRMAPGSIVEIDTPNLAFQVTRAGRYRISVDPQDRTTIVAVRNGSAAVYGEGASYAVAPGQGYRFYGTDLRDSEFVPTGGGDPFDRFVVERDARFNQSASARYVSQEVVGYEDLDRYGTWRPAGTYGNVWFPRQVANDWAPYRQGHWSWIDPWGWTWVDDAPWGFAPFHYGRWAYVENRWGWVPGPMNVRPVYAPALVAFVGGANFSLSVSAGPAIGWFPLAPREVYRPAYNVSRDYYRQVNVSNTVINTTVINNTYVSNFTANNVSAGREVDYANLRARNAVTAVPPAAFAQSLPVARAAVAMSPAQVDRAQVRNVAQVAPTRAAFIGGAAVTQSVPPRVREQQVVVARAAPPPPPVPIAQRMQALDKDPGKPQDRAEIRAERPASAGAAMDRNVRVVNSGVPPAAAAPPAVKDSSRTRAIPADAPRPNEGAQRAGPGNAPAAPPSAMTPRVPEVRGGPASADDRGRRNDSPPPSAAQQAPGIAPAQRGAPANAAQPVMPRGADARPASPAAPVTAAPPTVRPPARDDSADRGRAQAQPQTQPQVQPAPARPDPRATPQASPRTDPQVPPPARTRDVRPAQDDAARSNAPPAAAPAPVARPPEPRPAPQGDRARGAPPRDATPEPRTAPVPAPAQPKASESRPPVPPSPPQARAAEPKAAAPTPAAAPAAAPPIAAPPARGAPPRATTPSESRRDDKVDDKGNDKADDKRGGQKGKPD